MAGQSVVPKKKRGPAPTGKGVQIGMRWQPAELAAIDAWSAKQSDKPGRPEAIRRLVEQALRDTASPRPSPDRAQKAAKLAGGELDKLTDKSAPVEEQASR